MARPRQVIDLGMMVLIGLNPLAVGSDDPPVTREAVCRRVEAPPVIDGELDDPAWRQAERDAIVHFPAFWSGTDNGDGTRARLVWDDDALYFATTMTDSEVRSYGRKRNDTLWLGDVFELFFKPSNDSPRYYEFQVNPCSVILELPFPQRGDDFDEIAALPPPGSPPWPAWTGHSTDRGTRTVPGVWRGESPGRPSPRRVGGPRSATPGRSHSVATTTGRRAPSPSS